MKTDSSPILLLAHGTKEPEASEPVHYYARLLAQRLERPVWPCLREFIEPSIPTVVGRLANEGARRILVLPFFLFQSGHVVRDIAADLAAEKQKHPQLEFIVGEPLGVDQSLADLLEKRAFQMIQKASRSQPPI